VALLRKMTYNLKHPMGLRHPVTFDGNLCLGYCATSGFARLVWGRSKCSPSFLIHTYIHTYPWHPDGHAAAGTAGTISQKSARYTICCIKWLYSWLLRNLTRQRGGGGISSIVISLLILLYKIQGGEDPQDALSCRSFSAKEPLIIGLFCGKWPIKIRHPMDLGHPVAMQLTFEKF